ASRPGPSVFLKLSGSVHSLEGGTDAVLNLENHALEARPDGSVILAVGFAEKGVGALGDDGFFLDGNGEERRELAGWGYEFGEGREVGEPEPGPGSGAEANLGFGGRGERREREERWRRRGRKREGSCWRWHCKLGMDLL
ncbi:hypothetical protein V6N12_075827, partial [Hibiscus sabdariffa]